MRLAAVSIPTEFFRNQSGGVARLTATPGSLISLLLPTIYVIAGVIFFGLTIYHGFKLITTAGKNPTLTPDTQKYQLELSKFRASFSHSFIGFLLVIGSFFILQIISTIIGVDLINIPNF